MSVAMNLPLFATAVLAAGVAAATDDDVASRSAPPNKLRYLALGDSYTIGEGAGAEDRWPMQLVRALRARGIAIDDPRIIARTGWTTDELSTAIDAEFEAQSHAAPSAQSDAQAKDVQTEHALASPRFDFVSLLIGVNNQYRGRAVEEYATQFDALLARAIGFAGGRADRVMVLAIPDWGVTPFAAQSGRDRARIAQELDVFNTAAKRLCAARGVAFVDIAPVSRARGAEPSMLVEDGLHPSQAMYAEWTALALPVANRLLQASAR
jgi:lysophospholipase L1-like esterase